jgi:serine/threonine-protein kinase HipA
MSYAPARAIEVRAWGKRVGAIARDPNTHAYVFAYAPEWVATGIELSPLKMPLRTEPYSRTDWPELGRTSFHGIMPLLANSLPDDFGNALVDAWMAEHGVDHDQITALDRLAYAADRALGALEFYPPARESEDPAPSSIQMAELVLAARLTISGDFSDDDETHSALRQLISVGSSAGGQRAKAIIGFDPATSIIRSPYEELPEGFEHWLLKIDGVSEKGVDGHDRGLGESKQYGRIEYAYSLMAAAAGVTMSRCELLLEGPRAHFMTRRFDRDRGQRHHSLTLSAVAHLDHSLVGAHSYDQYFATIRQLGLGSGEVVQGFRRMVFNVAAVNRDDHAKNFGFLLREGGSWELAPAYDVTHSYRRDSEWTSVQNLSVNGRTEDIALEDLYAVAERHEVPGYRVIVREVVDAIEDWSEFASEAGVSASEQAHVTHDIRQLRPH